LDENKFVEMVVTVDDGRWRGECCSCSAMTLEELQHLAIAGLFGRSSSRV
jgi:hypothetical protein